LTDLAGAPRRPYRLEHSAVLSAVRKPAMGEVYVDVAEQHFALPFKRQTDSRVAMVTGISRKEIAPLRERIKINDRPVEVEERAVTHAIG